MSRRAELEILRLLAECGPLSGRELVKASKERGGSRFMRGTLYVHLMRLEDARLVEFGGGEHGRYCWITDAGRRAIPRVEERAAREQRALYTTIAIVIVAFVIAMALMKWWKP